MNKIFTIALALLFISCEQNTDELNQLRSEKEYVENNVQMYTSVWERVFSERNIDLVTSENFDENVTVVTAQGDDLVKYWNFKGTHDGDFFGIPATNKSLDLSGTTIVKMKDGKVLKEQDFFDNYSFMKQLGLIE